MTSRWYVIHVYSGFEKKVAASIREQAEQKALSDKFDEILVPTEEVVEVKRGAKVSSERKFFPGYVLIKMDMSDETWHLVKNTAKVTGFLGGRGRPSPISDGEAARIMHQVQEGIERPKPSVTFEVGEQVRVCDGPFTSFNGLVEDVDEERARLAPLADQRSRGVAHHAPGPGRDRAAETVDHLRDRRAGARL